MVYLELFTKRGNEWKEEELSDATPHAWMGAWSRAQASPVREPEHLRSVYCAPLLKKRESKNETMKEVLEGYDCIYVGFV
jgi:hypothetical protein